MEQLIASAKLLVVAHDSTIPQLISTVIRPHRWQLDVAANAWDALEKLHSGSRVDLLFVDLDSEEVHDFQILRWLRKIRPDVPMIVMDPVDDSGRRREALQLGSCDYLVRSRADFQLAAAIRRNLSMSGGAMQADAAKNDVEALGDGHIFIGLSPVMRKLRAQVDLLARNDSPVMILGEPGSGKQTVARLLHRLSVRSGFKFASLDCAALPQSLLEKEIFGNGALGGNGSPHRKRGKLELCSGGMLFLDEITEMPMQLQSLLAEALATGRFRAADISEDVKLDVRVVAASSVPVDQALSERRLAPQLYRQLCSHEVRVPPLRERREELDYLAHHFLHQLTRRYGLPAHALSAETMKAWRDYAWPGNMRELEQAVKRYLIAGDEQLGTRNHSAGGADSGQPAGLVVFSSLQPSELGKQQFSIGAGGYRSLRSFLKSVREDAERNAIALALEKTGWNRKAAARLLKISYRSILYKIDQYQMSSVSRPPRLASDGIEPGSDTYPRGCESNLAGVAGQTA